MAQVAARATSEEIQQRAIEQEPHHRRLIESADDGKRLSDLMRPLYAFATPRGHAVLTTTGRKSGQPRKKVIRAVRRGDTAFVVMLCPPALAKKRPNAVAAWVHNIRADARVTLRMGRHTFAGTAREITDEGDLESARAALCESVHAVDYGECLLHLKGIPTPAKIREMHRYWFETGIPVAVDLQI
ncbi:MAG: nitroreductase family deazaflavin-dependent oxidoreductase [Solirubrobacterales bacterium]